MAPWTLLEIDRALRASWAVDTCSPDDFARAGWAADNPAWGHCDITALLVNDLFGGDLMLGDVHDGAERQGFHWWNRLACGIELDLTREQFREGQTITSARLIERPGPRPSRRREEYERFRGRVAAILGPLPAPAGGPP